jgi:hypothetical protein
MRTINDRINRTARGLAWVSNLGFVAIFGIGLAWWLGFLDMTTAGKAIMAGLLTAIGAVCLIHAIGVRCPQCGQELVWGYRIEWFRFSDLRRCPRCRLDLDGPGPQANS